MKKFILLAVVLLTGCGTSYTTTQVGPDRFVHSAHGKDVGSNDYTAMLSKAYETCKSASYADYSVSRVLPEPENLVVYVQCEKEKLSPAATDARDNPNEAVQDLKRLYEAAKKKVEEKLNN